MSEGKISEAGLALCGAAPLPWRLRNVERFLAGRSAGDDGWHREAAGLAVREARPLGGNAYKVQLVQGLVERILRRLAGPG
jgi:xanthine dehydrogenase YagS FAD-binding subunit